MPGLDSRAGLRGLSKMERWGVTLFGPPCKVLRLLDEAQHHVKADDTLLEAMDGSKQGREGIGSVAPLGWGLPS